MGYESDGEVAAGEVGAGKPDALAEDFGTGPDSPTYKYDTGG